MSDVTELAQRMKAAALKATPGEWVYLPSNTSIEYDYGSDDSQGSITYMDSGDFTQKQTELNGIFIALANPANVLALVEALEARDLTLSARDYHYDQQADRIQSLEKALEAAAQNSDGVAGMAEHYETTISMLKSRIEELEARTVKLPDYRETYTTGFASEIEHQVRKVLEMVGNQVIEGEQNNG